MDFDEVPLFDLDDLECFNCSRLLAELLTDSILRLDFVLLFDMALDLISCSVEV